jgi:hypothetical protein
MMIQMIHVSAAIVIVGCFIQLYLYFSTKSLCKKTAEEALKKARDEAQAYWDNKINQRKTLICSSCKSTFTVGVCHDCYCDALPGD